MVSESHCQSFLKENDCDHSCMMYHCNIVKFPPSLVKAGPCRVLNKVEEDEIKVGGQLGCKLRESNKWKFWL